MKPKRVVYVEGGGGRKKDTRLRCREGFARLIAKCGFKRQPKIVPCGGRGQVRRKFRATHINSSIDDCILMLIDSEATVAEIEQTWDHLRRRDGWSKPRGATDDQVLFMTTCMETWIAADREALREAYARSGMNENALPPLDVLENRSPQDIFNRLKNGTNNQFDKGEESFKILGQLNPDTLAEYLPSFVRARRILNEKLDA